MGARQLGPHDCVLACLAMASDGPDVIYDEDYCARRWGSTFLSTINEEKGCDGKLLKHALTVFYPMPEVKHLRVLGVMYPETFFALLWGRAAMLQVDSLNIERGQHMVYWTGDTLHDPSYLKRYATLEDLPLPSNVWLFA